MRVLIAEDPYADLVPLLGWDWTKRGIWPCKWIACPDAGPPPFVCAYRRRFTVEADAVVRVHVTADERYELFLDGRRIGRGSERGDRDNWFFETYDLSLAPGEHLLVARVWSLGAGAPFAQMTVSPGFLLSPQEPEWQQRLGTGIADWEAKILPGYTFQNPLSAWGTGSKQTIDGARFAWGFEKGLGDGWRPAVSREFGADALRRNEFGPMHLLRPATLPPMREDRRSSGRVRLVAEAPSRETRAVPVRLADHLSGEGEAWDRLLQGRANLTVPPHTRRRVLLDLEDYVCAYPEVTLSGGTGGLVRVHWQEALYCEPDAKTKGNRDEIEGKYFATLWHDADGIGDSFLPDGGPQHTFETLWWECGRYIELLVETADEPLTVEAFHLRETRYPLEMDSEFSAADPRLSEVAPLAVRVMQMCSHETYMDCPYYEQLMYVGDTRLEALTTYVMTRDDRLPRKALQMFDASRLHSGLTQSRYPSRVTQIIPPFSLWWAGMVYDYALWRDDLALVRRLMPGVRGVLDLYLASRNAEGLIEGPEGWNYMDWVPEWDAGVPQHDWETVSGPINWQTVLVLGLVAQLEEWVGEPERAARARRLADELGARVETAFWDDRRGLFADDLGRTRFSEHAQCLAILSGRISDERQGTVAGNLLQDPELTRTTIMFSHYLFETFYTLGRGDALLERLNLWFDLKTRGLRTTVEMPEPTRSDCHAWAAHPLYHFFASFLGIRPQSPGFRTVRIAPALGELRQAEGTLVHPQGEIRVALRQEDGALSGFIVLPEGVGGTLAFGGKSQVLAPGRQAIALSS